MASKILYSGVQVMTTLYVHDVLNGVIFRQIRIRSCSLCSTLYTCQVLFFPNCHFNKLCVPATAKYNLDRRITRLISTSTDIDWVILAHYIT